MRPCFFGRAVLAVLLMGYAGTAIGTPLMRSLAPPWTTGDLIGTSVFSGRVGANNTAELGTMTVTEQIDGLRALAINPIPFLIAPRVLAMMIAMFCLLVFGDADAVGTERGAVLRIRILLERLIGCSISTRPS